MGPPGVGVGSMGGGGGMVHMNLGNVLHYLQAEWRKFERDRNEWEIERAEMRARIALLEGERRSMENLKTDLMRRVKMLEFALKQERSKYLTSNLNSAIPHPGGPNSSPPTSVPPHPASLPAHPASAIPPSKVAALASIERGGTDSGASSPLLKGDGDLPNVADRFGGTWGGVGAGGGGVNVGRGKARSRDYLKQCLQEITYLTSNATLNPLPSHTWSGIPRIRKSLNSVPPPSTMSTGEPLPHTGAPPVANVGSEAPHGSGSHIAGDMFTMLREKEKAAPPQIQSQQGNEHRSSPPSSAGVVASAFAGSDYEDLSAAASEYDESQVGNRVTAIFRPGSSEEWKERLRKAGEGMGMAVKSEKLKKKDEIGERGGEEKWEDEKEETNGTGHKVWRARKTLRSHLDSVRCIAFDWQDLSIASGGDDCTVKFWRLSSQSLGANNMRSSLPETEPQVTFRGHSSTVTSIALSTQQERIYSSSLDATVHVWAIPSRDRETYAPYDPSMKITTLVGHSDAIWDMALLPFKNLLATSSADGTVKVWSTETLKNPLKSSWDYRGAGGEGEEKQLAPTSVAVVNSDMKKLAVGWQDSVVRLFDLETGRMVLKFKSDETSDGTPATQINKVITHPTLPLLITAHEDKYIRFFDINTGACTHSMLAHLDSVTSLDIDPSGLTLVSGGHDCSIRFWDIQSKTCVQEISSHRNKGGEGILDVKYHPTSPVLGSAGADGIVKVYC
ncbi:WD40 repeat-like protein [Atractiella rhizophila]|nr:WD40 repeat-like protein [Atractiella rhizophila]